MALPAAGSTVSQRFFSILLGQLVLWDRFFFLSCGVLPLRGKLRDSEFLGLAEVVRERRRLHRFLLTGWFFLPDPAAAGHAIIFPRSPLTISRARESINVGATLRISRARGERGMLLQGRFFDRALRTAKEYNEKVEYIYFNPVRAGLVKRPEDWRWSSVHDDTGSLGAPSGWGSPIPVDRITLPAEERTPR